MANVDRPNGFYPSKLLGMGTAAFPILQIDLTSGENLVKGDGVIEASGFASILVAGSAQVLGVLAEPVDATSAAVTGPAYPALEGIMFQGQCSGTYTEASHRYAEVDMEGATSVMEVNENASSTDVIVIWDLVLEQNNAVGANAQVEFIWNKRVFSS